MTLTVSDFCIFANLANKCVATVTINQILTQKWFLLQNVKYLSLNLSFVMVFSIMENELLPVWPSFRKNLQIETGICHQKYFHTFQSISERYIWTTSEISGFFDLNLNNNC
jgi:hypothetical protein